LQTQIDIYADKALELFSAASYKNVGKPYNAADARHVDFTKFGGRGAPVVVDIGGVRQGMSELLQAVYTEPSYSLTYLFTLWLT